MLLNCSAGEDSWTVRSNQSSIHSPKGNQPLIFIGRTDAEAKAAMVRPPDAQNQLTGNYPDTGKDWGQEEKGSTEDEMVGWHHWLKGHEFEQTPGHSEGQGSLACCIPWGCSRTQLRDWRATWSIYVDLGISDLGVIMKVIVVEEEVNWKKIKPLQQNLKKKHNKTHIYIFSYVFDRRNDWDQVARMARWEEQEGSIPSSCVD